MLSTRKFRDNENLPYDTSTEAIYDTDLLPQDTSSCYIQNATSLSALTLF